MRKIKMEIRTGSFCFRKETSKIGRVNKENETKETKEFLGKRWQNGNNKHEANRFCWEEKNNDTKEKQGEKAKRKRNDPNF